MDWISLRVCRIVGIPCLVILLLLCANGAWGEPPADDAIRVARLVRELGAADFSKRQQADEQLSKLGQQGRAALEKALTDDDLEVRLRAKKLLERLKLDDLWAPTMVRYETHGELASKALATLATHAGNHIHIGDPYGTFSDKTLDLSYPSQTYWEAIDDICGRTGNQIRPHYDMHTPGIVVSTGNPGKYPRAYGGPARAQITGARRVFIEELNYEDRKAELTHSFQLGLQLTWEDRFRVVGYATQPELVEALTDNQVAISAAQPAGGGWTATTRGLRQVTANIKLNPVPVSAKTLAMFKIRWGLVAVGEPAVLEIPTLELNKLHCQDDLAVHLEAIEKQPTARYAVTLVVERDLAMPEPHEIVFQEYEAELTDTQGRLFRLQNQSHLLTDRGVQIKLAYTGETGDSEPKSLKLHYPRLRARRDLELVFRDVPLPVGKPD